MALNLASLNVRGQRDSSKCTRLLGEHKNLRVDVAAGRPQQVAGTRWFALRSVLEDLAHVCPYSDGCVQPLVRPGSHPWLRYQRRDHIAEDMTTGP